MLEVRYAVQFSTGCMERESRGGVLSDPTLSFAAGNPQAGAVIGIGCGERINITRGRQGVKRNQLHS